MRKVLLSLFLASLCTMSAFSTIIKSGNCGVSGDNLTWSLSDDYVLTISGSGDMAKYGLTSQDYGEWLTNAPWGLKVKKVLIGEGVTSVGYDAFSGCTLLEEVQFPNTLSKICNGAFYGCTSLKSIELTSGISTIEDNAFCYSGLEELTLPNNVSNCQCAFQNCASLKIIRDYSQHNNWPIFSQNLSLEDVYIYGEFYIDNYYGCNSLKNVTVYTNSKKSPYSNFPKDYNLYVPADCIDYYKKEWADYAKSITPIYEGKCGDNLIWTLSEDLETITISGSGDMYRGYLSSEKVKNVVINENVTSIAENAFYTSNKVTNVTLPSTLERIGDRAFYTSRNTRINIVDLASWCKIKHECIVARSPDMLYMNGVKLNDQISGDIIIPEGSYCVPPNTFLRNSKITSVSLPNTLKSIGNSALAGCTSLASVSLPNSLVTIGTFAFNGCTSLETIVIPKNVTTINASAFRGSGLTSIMSLATECPTLSSETFYGISKTIPVYVPKESIEQYSTKNVYWKEFTNIQGLPEFEISDNNSVIPSAFYAETLISYSRNSTAVAAGNYASICLPFDINLEDVNCFEKVYVPQGTALCREDGSLLIMLKEVNKIVKSGTPMLVLLNGNSIYLKNYDNVTIPADIADPEPIDLQVYDFNGTGILTENNNIVVKFGGTYNKIQNLDDNHYRAFDIDGRFGPTTWGNVFRSYIYKDDSASSAKIRSVTFGLGEQNEETVGICNVVTLPQAGNAIYNLQGQRVTAIQKGCVYIVNGKKLFNK